MFDPTQDPRQRSSAKAAPKWIAFAGKLYYRVDVRTPDTADLEVVPRSLEAALKDIAAIGVGTTSARDDALEMQRIARKALG